MLRIILMVFLPVLYFNVVIGQNRPISEDFTITPDSIVEPVGGKAEISCLYKPSPNRRVSWGVIKSGVDSVIFSGNTANSINVSADTKTLAFDPIIQSQEGNYYCWTAISAQENVYSKLVSLTILHKPVISNMDKQPTDVELTYNLTVRRPIRLNLTTFGSPVPELTLYKKQKDSNSYVVFTSKRFDVTLIGINITSVEPEDEGDYRLTATYQIYHNSEEFSIIVNIPPVAPTLKLELFAGKPCPDDESVTCVLAVIGSPVNISCKMTEAYTTHLRMYWSNGISMRISQTEVHLVIDKVDLTHDRQYYCHAINDVNATLRSVQLVVGSVPLPFTITATSNNGTLTVVWQNTNNTKPYDDEILAHYIQYRSVNGSRNDVVVQKIAASLQTTAFRNVTKGVEYAVSMWSANKFGNSSATNEVFVVIVGSKSTEKPIVNENDSGGDSNTAVIGVMVGVTVLVIVVFCVVVLVLFMLYWNNRRTQGQQQWPKDPEFQSQLSLSAGSVRVPHGPPSEIMQSHIPVPTYATPFLHNGFSSSSISKRSSEDNNWQIPRDNIQLSELLAEGEHTVLYRATAFGIGKFKKTAEVTVKQVKDNNSSPEEVKVLIEEMDLMQDLGVHPNVVNVLAVCTVGDPVYLIMDYFAHGDLLGFLRATRGHTEHYTVSAGTETKMPSCSIQPQDLLSLACQVANGMTFLEEKKVAHRSLCARNVLVGTGLQVKIYNYGQKNDDQSSYAKWMAPETLFDGTANTTSDVWSFGVTLWEIVTIGGSPYFQMRPEDMRKVLEDGYRMPNPDHCSEEIYKIMQDCWEYDPQDRPAFELINYRLETLSKSKLSYIDLKLYDEVLYSQFEDTPQLCTAL